jgi:hypothetical protein
MIVSSSFFLSSEVVHAGSTASWIDMLVTATQIRTNSQIHLGACSLNQGPRMNPHKMRVGKW